MFFSVLTMFALSVTLQLDPAYVLEAPGIQFNYLPEGICPIIEGQLTEEMGAVAGQPNSLGISFGCYYWKSENQIADKNLWLEEKLSSVIPPDFMESIHLGETVWTEGSMGTELRGTRSLGLMTELSFTFSPPSRAMGRGRAYGVFRNGYTVLLIMYGPSETNPQHYLEEIVSFANLTADSVSE